MNSKDKENKTLQDRIKKLFGLKGGIGNIKGRDDLSLTKETLAEIGPDSPIQHRIKIIRDLSEAVLQDHLEEHSIEKLWVLTQDLLQEDVSKEHRHVVFQFLCSLAQGQAEKLGIMRVQFFRLITSHSLPEDIGPRLDLLRALTDNGKEILYIEEQVAPFLLNWMPAVIGAYKTHDLLQLLVNLVKYNAAYIEDSTISGFIQNTCFICSCNQQEEVVLASLALLDVVVCYAQIPPGMLETFIPTLCVSVNAENVCQSCWMIMRKLLGTHLGHSALLHMCHLMQEPTSSSNAALLRGAVFHVSMGMWGSQKVTSLNTTASAVLPSFVQVLKANNPMVTYEVILCVRRLVCQNPQDLTDSAWDPVLSILEETVSQVSQTNYPLQIVSITLHDTLTNVESLYEKGDFRGDVGRFFHVIDTCAAARPEPSVLRLISYLASDLTPTRHEWLTKLKDLLERYFWCETRTNIRVKVLDVLSSVIHVNRALYEEELVDRVLGQLDVAVTRDPDPAVRNATVQLLVELCLECDTKRCLELLDLIEKFLNRPFEVFDVDGSVVVGEAEALDVKSAALGMIKIFKMKAYQLPSAHAIRAYRALVNHLENHYRHPKVFENCSSTRFLIFRCFMQIRANSLYHLGMPESLVLDNEIDGGSPLNSPLRYSAYLAVDHRHGERPAPAVPSTPAPAPVPSSTSSTTQASPQAVPTTTAPPPATFPAPVVTHLSLQHACKAVIICLKQEKDWRVLHLVLRELPQVLQNKALVLSRNGNDIEYLASALCAMVSDKSLSLPESLRNVPTTNKLSRSDFQSLVLVSLASLASYPLEPGLQQRLVKCLQVGLASRCAGACVSALTLCTLEMRDTMYKLLPEVLLNLSKISATVHVAIPILEFLSTLTRLPKVFASFVGDQYMSVFAIALPYTNPFKYNHYTVSLAHHVIAVWFLKCRLPFRRDFVKFIITGLKANVLVPFEDQKMKPEIVNEDSSNRKRSSSLTEQGSRRREQLSQQRLDVKPAVDEALLTFHTELTETCIDLMARHTFSSCAALPRRLGSADWLLSGGQSMTWLIGHKLVTVTTSGCTQKAIRGGLCDKCLSSCLRLSPEKPVPTSPLIEPAVAELDLTPSRRRHKSAIQRSVSGEQMTPLAPRTKDDLHMNSMAPAAKITYSDFQTRPEQLLFSQSERAPENSERALCSCWCQGWAEIHVRRPTGNISWVMRLQNPPYLHASSPLAPDFPMSDISTLFLASLGNNEVPHSAEVSPEPEVIPEATFDTNSVLPVAVAISTPNIQSIVVSPEVATVERPSSEAVPVPGSSSSLDCEAEEDSSDCEPGQEGVVRQRRNPVRRSNSSPEMSGRLKSPMMPPAVIVNPLQGSTDHEIPPPSPGPDDKKLTNKLPPTRVSCEAIPEEMAGTTPPSTSSDSSVPPMQLTIYPAVTLSPNPTLNNSVTSPHVTTSISNMGSLTPKTPSVTSTNVPPITPNSGAIVSSAATPSPNVANTIHNMSPMTPNTVTATASKAVLAPTRSAPPQQPPSADKPRVERSPPQDNRPDPSALPPLAFRDRGHTISVMSPVRKPDWGALRRSGGPASPRSSKDQAPRSGINPSFVFLQLYHDGQLGASGDRPLLVAQSEMVNLALRTLDYIPPYETHKLGVLYVGPGHANNEQAILQNQAGSVRYTEFLQGLGSLVRLRDVDPQTTFLGGLDVNGNDGKFAYIWQDAMTQVIFHTATLMPTKDTDLSCNNKKLHIGNDYVTIVFNESGEDYNVQCIKGQFNFACVVVNPVGHGTNQVTVKAKEVLAKHLGALETRVISDQSLPTLVRQLALHANLASMIVKQTQAPYASNWLERLRHIKRLRARVCSGSEGATSEARSPPSGLQKRVQMDDFTEYTHYK